MYRITDDEVAQMNRNSDLDQAKSQKKHIEQLEKRVEHLEQIIVALVEQIKKEK